MKPCLPRIEADSIDDLLHVVTQEWPLILGIDAVSLALIIGDDGFPRRLQRRPSRRAVSC